MSNPTTLSLACAAALLPAAAANGQPRAVEFLETGRLAEGARALEQHLKDNPGDDEARFGLGVLQFFQTFEHLGAGLHRYGLRTERVLGRTPEAVRLLFPQNPNPEQLTYKAFLGLLETVVADLNRAEATLAQVKSPSVKLPLRPGLIKADLFGQGKPVNAAFLLGRFRMPVSPEQAEQFLIKFDAGDVHWLRGYCHFLAAGGEALLALDGREWFECSAHLFFEDVDTPHRFLLEQRRPFDEAMAGGFDRPLISDVVSFIHQSLRWSIREPGRMRKALGHLESMQVEAKAMWECYLAETDDDHEWIPNPRQTGVLGVPVTQDMVDTWLVTLDEAGLVLKGERLLPFWRGANPKLGVNLRRVFTEPRTVDVVSWVQGTAATSYLEEGPLTRFIEPNLLGRINRDFGGLNFFGFAFWFN